LRPRATAPISPALRFTRSLSRIRRWPAPVEKVSAAHGLAILPVLDLHPSRGVSSISGVHQLGYDPPPCRARK
jgi:hypothetical protein